MSPDKTLQARWSLVESDLSRSIRTARDEHDRDSRFTRARPQAREAPSSAARSGRSHELDFKIKLMKA